MPDPLTGVFHRPTTQLSSTTRRHWAMWGGDLQATAICGRGPKPAGRPPRLVNDPGDPHAICPCGGGRRPLHRRPFYAPRSGCPRRAPPLGDTHDGSRAYVSGCRWRQAVPRLARLARPGAGPRHGPDPVGVPDAEPGCWLGRCSAGHGLHRLSGRLPVCPGCGYWGAHLAVQDPGTAPLPPAFSADTLLSALQKGFYMHCMPGQGTPGCGFAPEIVCKVPRSSPTGWSISPLEVRYTRWQPMRVRSPGSISSNWSGHSSGSGNSPCLDRPASPAAGGVFSLETSRMGFSRSQQWPRRRSMSVIPRATCMPGMP